MLINRNFAKLWTGQAISVVGDEVFRTTLLLWTGIILLAGKSYAPAVSGAVLVITSLVIVLLGPLAGVYADRWDKKRTMLRMDLIRAALIGALVGVSIFASTLPLPVILAVIGVVVAAETAAAMFFGPAKVVIIRDVVPEESQGRASGLIQSASGLAGIIGPPLAAPLLVGVSVPVAIGVNAVSFVLSYVLIRAIKVPPQPAAPAPGESVWGGLREGLGHIRGNPVVKAVLGTAFVICLGFGAFAALDVYFVSENLGADATWFGLLGGAFSAGAISGSFVAGFLSDKVGAVRIVTGGLVMAGVMFVVYSRLSNVYAGLVVIALTGLALGALNTALFPVIMRSVPRELLGRVAAVVAPANQLGMIVSIAVSSVLASTVLLGLDATVAGVHLGRIDAIFLVAGVLMALSGVYFGVAARKFPDSAQDPGEVVVAE